MSEKTPIPTEICYTRETKILTVRFDNERTFDLPAELLRVESPSADVQGHKASEKKIVAGKLHVRISAIEPVGNYAIRICFDDGHDSGFYTWGWLYRLGEDMRPIWAEYLKNLARSGLSRDPEAIGGGYC